MTLQRSALNICDCGSYAWFASVRSRNGTRSRAATNARALGRSIGAARAAITSAGAVLTLIGAGRGNMTIKGSSAATAPALNPGTVSRSAARRIGRAVGRRIAALPPPAEPLPVPAPDSPPGLSTGCAVAANNRATSGSASDEGWPASVNRVASAAASNGSTRPPDTTFARLKRPCMSRIWPLSIAGVGPLSSAPPAPTEASILVSATGTAQGSPR